MGGIALDMTHDPERVWPIGFDRLTISAKGYLYLLQEGYADVLPQISQISEEAIKDKSKANVLAKAIVCVQATWFCVQLVIRFAEDLPISLLELSTFAHTLCAFLIYLFWWEKPLDIEEPLLVPTQSSEELRKLCTQVLTRSWLPPMSRIYPHRHFRTREDKALTAIERASCGLDVLPLALPKDEPHRTLLEPPFRGLGRKVDDLVFTYDDPPLLFLRLGDKIPGTSFEVP